MLRSVMENAVERARACEAENVNVLYLFLLYIEGKKMEFF